MRRLVPLLLPCLALLALAPACSDSTRPPVPPLPAPDPNTPVNALRLLEWSWNNRNCDSLEPLFTEDFRFVFATGDSAGNAYQDTPWTREDELAASCNLFAQALDVGLDMGQTLYALSDTRPGRNPVWHKAVHAPVNLMVTVGGDAGPEVNEVHGYAYFYLVRGDSAAIPPELVARGFGPDSTRWWIDRWEDATAPMGGASGHPAQSRSWGAIKVLFR